MPFYGTAAILEAILDFLVYQSHDFNFDSTIAFPGIKNMGVDTKTNALQ